MATPTGSAIAEATGGHDGEDEAKAADTFLPPPAVSLSLATAVTLAPFVLAKFGKARWSRHLVLDDLHQSEAIAAALIGVDLDGSSLSQPQWVTLLKMFNPECPDTTSVEMARIFVKTQLDHARKDLQQRLARRAPLARSSLHASNAAAMLKGIINDLTRQALTNKTKEVTFPLDLLKFSLRLAHKPWTLVVRDDYADWYKTACTRISAHPSGPRIRPGEVAPDPAGLDDDGDSPMSTNESSSGTDAELTPHLFLIGHPGTGKSCFLLYALWRLLLSGVAPVLLVAGNVQLHPHGVAYLFDGDHSQMLTNPAAEWAAVINSIHDAGRTAVVLYDPAHDSRSLLHTVQTFDVPVIAALSQPSRLGKGNLKEFGQCRLYTRLPDRKFQFAVLKNRASLWRGVSPSDKWHRFQYIQARYNLNLHDYRHNEEEIQTMYKQATVSTDVRVVLSTAIRMQGRIPGEHKGLPHMLFHVEPMQAPLHAAYYVEPTSPYARRIIGRLIVLAQTRKTIELLTNSATFPAFRGCVWESVAIRYLSGGCELKLTALTGRKRSHTLTLAKRKRAPCVLSTRFEDRDVGREFVAGIPVTERASIVLELVTCFPGLDLLLPEGVLVQITLALVHVLSLRGLAYAAYTLLLITEDEFFDALEVCAKYSKQPGSKAKRLEAEFVSEKLRKQRSLNRRAAKRARHTPGDERVARRSSDDTTKPRIKVLVVAPVSDSPGEALKRPGEFSKHFKAMPIVVGGTHLTDEEYASVPWLDRVDQYVAEVNVRNAVVDVAALVAESEIPVGEAARDREGAGAAGAGAAGAGVAGAGAAGWGCMAGAGAGAN